MYQLKLSVWRKISIFINFMALLLMLSIAISLMPREIDGDRLLFVNIVIYIDKHYPDEYDISELMDKYKTSHGSYKEAIAAISADFQSLEFKQELDRLKKEREDYLNALPYRQAKAVLSTLLAWVLFVMLFYMSELAALYIFKRYKSRSKGSD